jgi:hypothetical protein
VTCYRGDLRTFIYLLIASASNDCVVGAGHSLSTGSAGKDPRDRVANPFSDPPLVAVPPTNYQSPGDPVGNQTPVMITSDNAASVALSVGVGFEFMFQ